MLGGWATATAIIPAVAAQQIARSWCGLEAECFDGVPLIGPAPALDGLYLALGFSGHGFQLAPAVGRAVADEMMGEQDDALAGLRPERMLGFDPAALATFLTGPDARSEMR